MSDMCVCKREKEIDEIKDEVRRLRDFQYTDHDLLIRLDIKMDGVTTVLETLVEKVELLTAQPGDRYDKLKLAGLVTLITSIITYFLQMVLS